MNRLEAQLVSSNPGNLKDIGTEGAGGIKIGRLAPAPFTSDWVSQDHKTNGNQFKQRTLHRAVYMTTLEEARGTGAACLVER